jgi:hypothetical protein
LAVKAVRLGEHIDRTYPYLSGVTSPIRSHRAASSGATRTTLVFLALFALASTAVVTWWGVVVYNESRNGSSARFQPVDRDQTPSQLPSPASGAPELPDEQPADTVESAGPETGTAGPTEALGGGGKPGESGTASTATVDDARPGQPCQPEGAIGQDRSGGLLRCTSRPAGRQPRWRRTS